jgi:hypothetical protein
MVTTVVVGATTPYFKTAAAQTTTTINGGNVNAPIVGTNNGTINNINPTAPASGPHQTIEFNTFIGPSNTIDIKSKGPASASYNTMFGRENSGISGRRSKRNGRL